MVNLFVALIIISSPSLTRNTYNSTSQTSLETYVAANKLCIGLLKTHIPSFFARPLGGVLTNPVLQIFKATYS